MSIRKGFPRSTKPNFWIIEWVAVEVFSIVASAFIFATTNTGFNSAISTILDALNP